MEDVQQGTFDYTLTKPADAQLLVSVSEIRIFKVLDILLDAAEATGATLVTVTHDHDLLPRFDRSIDVMELLVTPEKPQMTQIDADGGGST